MQAVYNWHETHMGSRAKALPQLLVSIWHAVALSCRLEILVTAQLLTGPFYIIISLLCSPSVFSNVWIWDNCRGVIGIHHVLKWHGPLGASTESTSGFHNVFFFFFFELKFCSSLLIDITDFTWMSVTRITAHKWCQRAGEQLRAEVMGECWLEPLLLGMFLHCGFKLCDSTKKMLTGCH